MLIQPIFKVKEAMPPIAKVLITLTAVEAAETKPFYIKVMLQTIAQAV